MNRESCVHQMSGNLGREVRDEENSQWLMVNCQVENRDGGRIDEASDKVGEFLEPLNLKTGKFGILRPPRDSR